jgi:hypothetical protein
MPQLNSRYTFRHFVLYVPAGADTHGIDPRSAIVANVEQRGNDMLLVYYEGGRYASNLKQYSQRVLVAAGRQSERYPTLGKSMLPAQDLKEVGTFDLEAQTMDITDRAALKAWLDGQLIE